MIGTFGLSAILHSFFITTFFIRTLMLRIECFHSRDYPPYWLTETKGSICIKIEFNSQRFSFFPEVSWRPFLCFGIPTWPP